MSRRGVSFVIAGAAGAATLTAASAPSPLYPVYQRLWGFSAFTLTLVFAVYVFALLAALLTVGSLSDHVGRRLVASVALVILALGMLLFATAKSVDGLMIARVVQGFAVGAATGTTTAMLVDAAPSPRVGGIVSSAVPPLGIAIGSVLAGALVQYAPFPRQLVFWVLGSLYLALSGLVWTIPVRTGHGTASREPIWRSLLPSARLPAAVRPAFFALVPSIAATWALSGLYLSLGSSLLTTVFHLHSDLLVGAALGMFFTAGMAGAVVSAFVPRPLREWSGYGSLVIGLLITVAALQTNTVWVYLAGSVVAGAGFGASFRFAVDLLGRAAPLASRGQVFATMYIVSYLAFSVPALAAGLSADRFGLKPTALTYGLFEVGLVMLAMVASIVRSQRQDREPGRPLRAAKV